MARRASFRAGFRSGAFGGSIGRSSLLSSYNLAQLLASESTGPASAQSSGVVSIDPLAPLPAVVNSAPPAQVVSSSASAAPARGSGTLPTPTIPTPVKPPTAPVSVTSQVNYKPPQALAEPDAPKFTTPPPAPVTSQVTYKPHQALAEPDAPKVAAVTSKTVAPPTPAKTATASKTTPAPAKPKSAPKVTIPSSKLAKLANS